MPPGDSLNFRENHNPMKFLVFLFIIPAILVPARLATVIKIIYTASSPIFFTPLEVKRIPYKIGELREIKTGGFQDYITIYLYTDTISTVIHEASLEIDREWMDEANGGDLARDLVKSFLLDFICKADQPKAMAAGIFCLIARQQKINLPCICRMSSTIKEILYRSNFQNVL